MPNYEVCRKFVTALHLVNSDNIDFQVGTRDDGTEFEGDVIRLKLLSKKPPVDFESYRAPSIKNNSKSKKKEEEKEEEDILALDIERDVLGKNGKSRSKKNKKRKAKEEDLTESNNGSSSQNVESSKGYSSQPIKRSKNKHTNEESPSNKDENTDPNQTPRFKHKQLSFSQPTKTETIFLQRTTSMV